MTTDMEKGQRQEKLARHLLHRRRLALGEHGVRDVPIISEHRVVVSPLHRSEDRGAGKSCRHSRGPV